MSHSHTTLLACALSAMTLLGCQKPATPPAPKALDAAPAQTRMPANPADDKK